MDKSLIDPLRPQTREESRYRLMLLVARAACAVTALGAAVGLRPLAALPVLIVLGVAVVGAEYAYRRSLERERQRRKRMAEEAEREKQFRAIRQAQRAAAQKYFDEQFLVLDRTCAVVPEPAAGNRGF